eukprot:gene33782-38180_t
MPSRCSPLARAISPMMALTRSTLATTSDIVTPACPTSRLPASTRSTEVPISSLISRAAAAERFYQGQGINSVPAVIINDRHLISGGQPAEMFERALRQIMAGG